MTEARKLIKRSGDVLTAATSESRTLARRTLPQTYGIVWYSGRDGSSSSSSSMYVTLASCSGTQRHRSPSWMWVQFLLRDAMHKRGLCRHAVSVCVSVRQLRSWIVSKRIIISSEFINRQVDPSFQFFYTNRDGDIQTGTPITGTSNARGYEKITIFDQYLTLSPK